VTLKLITLLGAAFLAGGAASAAAEAGGNVSAVDLAIDGQHATRTFVDAAPKHTRTATIDATFVTTAPGTSAKHDGSEQLTGTLRLPQGQIAVLGTVGAYVRVTHVAIVGGTGRYAGARGDVTALFTPRAVKLRVALT
jgi:hypothetical protein